MVGGHCMAEVDDVLSSPDYIVLDLVTKVQNTKLEVLYPKEE